MSKLTNAAVFLVLSVTLGVAGALWVDGAGVGGAVLLCALGTASSMCVYPVCFRITRRPILLSTAPVIVMLCTLFILNPARWLTEIASSVAIGVVCLIGSMFGSFVVSCLLSISRDIANPRLPEVSDTE